MKNIMHKVLVPIYNEMVYVTFSYEAATSKFCEDEEKKHRSANGLAYEGTDHIGRTVFVLYVRMNDEGGISIPVIAHECFHVVDMILEKKGVQYKEGSGNEHVAYFLDWMVSKVLDCHDLNK